MVLALSGGHAWRPDAAATRGVCERALDDAAVVHAPTEHRIAHPPAATTAESAAYRSTAAVAAKRGAAAKLTSCVQLLIQKGGSGGNCRLQEAARCAMERTAWNVGHWWPLAVA